MATGIPPSPISVLLVDDHPLLRTGLMDAVGSQADMRVAGEAGSGQEAIDLYLALRPDVTVMDIAMPGLCGVKALEAIRREDASARIVLLTTCRGDVPIMRAMQAGVAGFLLKSAPREQLLDTIRKVHAGQRCIPPEIVMELAEHLGSGPLSEREAEVLRHAAGGQSNRRIAERLSISQETVKAHMKNVLAKLAANDRTHAVTIALQRGIIVL